MLDKTILVSPMEARKILGGIGKNVIYDLCKEKEFPSFKIGSKFYINKEKLQEWADKQCR
ncbi:MAG: hypothetical protein PWP67_2010 [Clostridium butyricum]|nr:hypothetical protein [Clostridium butyricum]